MMKTLVTSIQKYDVRTLKKNCQPVMNVPITQNRSRKIVPNIMPKMLARSSLVGKKHLSAPCGAISGKIFHGPETNTKNCVFFANFLGGPMAAIQLVWSNGSIFLLPSVCSELVKGKSLRTMLHCECDGCS